MRAVQATADTVRRLQKPSAFVLNQTPVRSFRTREAERALGLISSVAGVSIVSRNDHQDAQGIGLGVTEYDPNGKAADEVRKLWKWLDNRLGKIKNGETTAQSA